MLNNGMIINLQVLYVSKNRKVNNNQKKLY